MKKICWALTCLLITCAQTWADEKKPEKSLPTQVIDVRTKQEYDRGHLKDAINIPHTQIKAKIKDYVKSKATKILLYCHSGGRAAYAARILKGMGYKNVVNGGSYARLKRLEEKKEKEKQTKE